MPATRNSHSLLLLLLFATIFACAQATPSSSSEHPTQILTRHWRLVHCSKKKNTTTAEDQLLNFQLHLRFDPDGLAALHRFHTQSHNGEETEEKAEEGATLTSGRKTVKARVSENGFSSSSSSSSSNKCRTDPKIVSPHCHLSVEEKASSSSTSIQCALQYWRCLLAPNDDRVRQVEEWLTHGFLSTTTTTTTTKEKEDRISVVQRYCSFHWDHIACEKVPLRIVERLFQTEMCWYEQQNPGIVGQIIPSIQTTTTSQRVGEKKNNSNTRRKLFANSDISFPREHIELVSGLEAFDPNLRMKHHGRIKKQGQQEERGGGQQQQQQQQQGSGQQRRIATADFEYYGGHMAHPHIWPMTKQLSSLKTSSATTSAPMVLAQYLSVRQNRVGSVVQLFFVPRCSDGTPLRGEYYLKTPSCASSSPPKMVSVFLRRVSDDSLLSSRQYNLGSDICAPTQSTTFWTSPLISNTNSTAYNATVCYVEPNSHLRGMGEWSEYYLTALSKFEDGTSSEEAITVSFFDGSFGQTKNSYFANASRHSNFSTRYRYRPQTITSPREIRPTDIAKAYGIPSSELSRTSQRDVVQGILEFSDEEAPGAGFKVDDLSKFLDTVGVTFNTSLLQIIGSVDTMFQDETSLDVEMMMGMCPQAFTYLWNVENGPNKKYLRYVDAFIGWAADVMSPDGNVARRPASVWSASYGGPEWGAESDRLNTYFKALQAAGITFVASTGDEGAGWVEEPNFWVPTPQFPASAPYAIAAGGTSLVRRTAFNPNDGRYATEMVCAADQGNIITTGGGFSSQFAVPDYQSDSTFEYISALHTDYPSSKDTLATYYNPNRRATPDISAIASWIYVVINNETGTMFGTSASAPIIASMISLFNDRRLRSRKSTLKLAHSFFYSPTLIGNSSDRGNYSKHFYDVTIGDNCVGEASEYGAQYPAFNWTTCFTAANGYDAVSGLGSLKYNQILTHALRWNPTVEDAATPDPLDKGIIAVEIIVALVVTIAVAVLAFWKFHRDNPESPTSPGSPKAAHGAPPTGDDLESPMLNEN